MIAVAGHHWLPNFAAGLPLGSGVQLFFVISGYLITGILLAGKVAVGRGEAAHSDVLKSFYARRFLRIFPLYYAVLLMATALDVSDVRSMFAWHFLYLSNFCFIHQQHWPGAISHLWTLAVEEQFYLFWPLLILWAPRRWLPAWMLLFVAIGPIYRLLGRVIYPDAKLWGLGTAGSFDSLALGSLLCYCTRYPTALFASIYRLRALVCAACLLCYGVIRYTHPLGAGFTVIQTTLLSTAFCVVVLGAAEGFTGKLGRLMNLGVLRYIGRISYGLYLFHNFASLPTQYLLKHLAIRHPPAGLPLLLNAVITVAAASLSWHFFERPINALKRYFAFSSHHAPGAEQRAIESTARAAQAQSSRNPQ